MSATAFELPAGFNEDDEYPIATPPDIPLWSENYHHQAHDGTAGIALVMHLGRTPYDVTLWRQLILVALPSGEVLIDKSYGRTADGRGPGAGTLRFECQEPWRRWLVRSQGAAVRARREDLARSFASDGLHVPLSLELEYEAAGPVWDMSASMEGQSWGEIHYEQLCRVRGTIRYGDAAVAFDGGGVRDHTRGARDFSPLERYGWVHAVFPSGRGFIAMVVEAGEHHLSQATVLAEGRLHEAQIERAPLLPSAGAADEPYAFELRWEGARATIRGEVLRTIPCGLIVPNEFAAGCDPAVVSHPLFEGVTRYTWDDEVGYGMTERLIRRAG